jgi:hypothetical protein
MRRRGLSKVTAGQPDKDWQACSSGLPMIAGHKAHALQSSYANIGVKCLQKMDWILDDRSDCWSVMTHLPVREYLALVKEAHENQGGLSGQREVLKTTTARRIRERMVDDIRNGAVLPPVVIGMVISKATFASLPMEQADTLSEIVGPEESIALSIIDGMQRTGALMEAAKADSSVLDQSIRVEFWLTEHVGSMIYRMLVLNTGQVPWTLSRQLSVVYTPLLKEVKSNVPEIDKIFTPDTPGRRVAAGQYGSDVLVELYLSFSLRKTNIDAKEALSEEFSRLDVVDNLSSENFQTHFYNTLGILAKLDKEFSRFESTGKDRFSKGRHIFDSQPARIGFMAAVAHTVLGRPGLDKDAPNRSRLMREVQTGATALISRLAAMSPEKVGEFLALDVLGEIVAKRVGQVGRYERAVFFDAFKVLIDEGFDLPTMEPCWRAN